MYMYKIMNILWLSSHKSMPLPDVPCMTRYVTNLDLTSISNEIN